MQQTSSCTRAISGVSTSDRSGAGVGILPHLTTLIIQDLVLVLGSGAGGHTTLGWVTGVYLSTVAGWRLQSLTSRQWIKYDQEAYKGEI